MVSTNWATGATMACLLYLYGASSNVQHVVAQTIKPSSLFMNQETLRRMHPLALLSARAVTHNSMQSIFISLVCLSDPFGCRSAACIVTDLPEWSFADLEKKKKKKKVLNTCSIFSFGSGTGPHIGSAAQAGMCVY